MLKTTRRYPLTLLAAFIWVIVTLLIYYWVHRPFTPMVAQHIGGAMLDFGSALLMITVAGGLGRSLLMRLLPDWRENFSRGERIGSEALLGIGILSLLLLAVGLIWLSALSVLILLLAIMLISGRDLIGWAGDVWQARRFQLENGWQRGLMAFILINLLMAIIMGLAPPTKFDALTYHLVGAKLWVAEGQFTALTDSHFFAFPQLINTLFAGQMALLNGRLTGAASLHGLIGMLGLLITGSYALRRFNQAIGLLAVAILLSATSLWLQFAWAYVDLATLAFGIATFIALEQWRQSFSDRWLMLAAVFVGFTMSVKYTGVGWGLAAGLYVLVYGWRDGFPALIRRGLLYGIVAALILAPWLLRNALFYDNPVYPFGPLTGEWDALTRDWYVAPDRALLVESPQYYWTMPLSATWLGVEGLGHFQTTIGALFLLLIPMLLITWRGLDTTWRTGLKAAGVLIGGLWLFWLIQAAGSIYGGQTRLVYMMFPLLALLAAVGLESLRKLPPRPLAFDWMMRVVVGIVLLLTLINHIVGQRPTRNVFEGSTTESHFLESRSYLYVMGIIDQDTYLGERLGIYTLAVEAINALPDDSTVLFLWEPFTLYCDEPRLTCIEDSISIRWWRSRRTTGDGSATAILNHWRDQGITHVLYSERGFTIDQDYRAERYTAADIEVWATMQTYLEPVWIIDDYTLYQLPTVEQQP